METRILQRNKLPALIDELIQDREVIAPIDGQSYGKVSSASEVYFSVGKPAKSLKEFFFPQRETLFEFRAVAKKVELAPPSSPDISRVIVGAHPCDVASLPILDALFAWDYLDPSYLERREKTLIISLACEQPAKTCFCTSVGCSPTSTEGSDLLLIPLGDVYHVQIVTDRGKALVEKYGGFFQESDQEQEQRKDHFEAEQREQLTKQVNTEKLHTTLDFENPLWKTITQQCVDCGICTFLCPTCHCFDIHDEVDPDTGSRVRLWDACAFQSFTKTHAGQPRPNHYQRYRQRIMHKFKYYPENFGMVLCVGCGRCIQYCPVSIDLRDVLTMVEE